MSQIFDQRFRLLQKSTTGIQDLTFGMDAVGNILSITDQLDPAKSQSFGFDDLYRLTSAEGVYGSIGYTYDKVGNRLSINRNGTSDIYSYINGTNRLSEAGGIPYTYDDNGNPTAIGTNALTYNDNNRLIHVAENGSVLGEYTYNALGQRVVKTSDGQTTIYIYDQQGNLIAEADAEGNINQEYIWLEGRLLAAVKSGKIQIEATVDIDPDTLNLNSNGNWITAYIGLPQGYDVTEIDPATITLNKSVLAERVQVGDEDGDGIPDLMVKFDRAQVSDILQPGDEVEIVVEGEADTFLISGTDTIRVIGKGKKKKKGQGTAGQSVATISTATGSNRVVFYHLDHLGAPQVMTDEDGEVVWLADYLPFGQTDATVEVVGNKFRSSGQYYDENTGLHYNYHRYYDPKTGRYLTPDPIGLLGMDPNLYGYVLNNPINLIDPEGLFNPIKGASAIGNVFLSAFAASSGSVKYGIAAGLLPASATGVGSLPSITLVAWGTWNFKASMAAWNRAVTQWEEALSEDFSEAKWKNLYGLLPGGTEYDDPCESSGPVDYIRSQGWFRFLSEAGYF